MITYRTPLPPSQSKVSFCIIKKTRVHFLNIYHVSNNIQTLTIFLVNILKYIPIDNSLFKVTNKSTETNTREILLHFVFCVYLFIYILVFYFYSFFSFSIVHLVQANNEKIFLWISHLLDLSKVSITSPSFYFYQRYLFILLL